MYSSKGVPKLKILEILEVSGSTYYSWKKKIPTDTRIKSCMRITPREKAAIIVLKKMNPEYGVCRISGQLRRDGVCVSPTTCYNYLKEEGLIIPLNNRPDPNREPKYLPFLPNQQWALDWSYIRINGERWNILTMIDCFSKYLIGFGVLKTIKAVDIQELITAVHEDQELEIGEDVKVVMDQGAQNKAKSTLNLIEELGMKSKFSEVGRPTQNAYMERWYKTLKQELVYPFGRDGFKNYDIAMDIIGKFVDNYNNERPHQSICNFVPHEAHYVYKNMSVMISLYKSMVIDARNLRINYYKLTG